MVYPVDIASVFLFLNKLWQHESLQSLVKCAQQYIFLVPCIVAHMLNSSSRFFFSFVTLRLVMKLDNFHACTASP